MGSIDLFAAFMLFGIVQGVLLIIAINRLPQRNKAANRVLSVFIFLVSFTLLWRITKTQGILQLVMGITQDIIIFLYGPVFYLYVQILLTTSKPSFKKWRLHLIPAFIYLCSIPPMWYAKEFWMVIYMATGTLAIIHSSFYMIKSFQLIWNFRNKSGVKGAYTRYLQTIIALVGLCLVMALYTMTLYFIKAPEYKLEFFNYNVAWFILAFITYALGYFAMFTPEIFKLPAAEITPQPLFSKKSTSSKKELPKKEPPKKEPLKKELNTEDLLQWKARLTHLMQHEKPYLNPKLTLADLGELLDMDKLMVSRVIHEGFQLNFYDYINTYRIEHFVELSQNEKYQHYTLLALGYEVGFNAKSTFHKAFKRLKNSSPKAYLESLMTQ